MKCFAMGPVEMFPDTLEISKKQLPYFRTEEFSKIVIDSQVRLKNLINAPQSSEVVFLTASGTAAMEATVFNCFTKEDKLLVISGGTFGKRFTDICRTYSIPYEAIELEVDEILTKNHLEIYSNQGFTGLLVNIHETATGQLYDAEMLADFCKENNMYFVVDAISSILADKFDAEKYSADAVILSSQKGLALDPGMAFVILSKRIWKNRVCRITPPSMYFDFKDYVKMNTSGQTPYTPAIRIILQLNDRLIQIEKDGIESTLDYVAEIAEDMRKKLKNINGVSIPDYPLSNACTPVVFDDEKADKIYNLMKDKYGIILAPCSGGLKKQIIRIGHIGNHTIEENLIVTNALEKALAEL